VASSSTVPAKYGSISHAAFHFIECIAYKFLLIFNNKLLHM